MRFTVQGGRLVRDDEITSGAGLLGKPVEGKPHVYCDEEGDPKSCPKQAVRVPKPPPVGAVN